MIQLLAISGSLRAASSNTALLRAASRLAPEGVAILFYEGLGNLPHFNPDLEEAEPPAVTDLRGQIREVDGLLISAPEYAHGVPGVLKNALDWLVGGEEFVGKPVALLNAAPRSTHAQASLTETVKTMSARLVAEASISVPLLGKDLDEDAIVAHPEISGAVRVALAAFAREIATFKQGFRIYGLDHVQLAMPAGQEDLARAFYGGTLGLTEIPKPPQLAGRGGVWFSCGALQMHLGVEKDFRPARKAHPAFLVEQLDALCQRCREAGIDLVPDEPLEGRRRIFVHDPFGNRIELIEPLAP